MESKGLVKPQTKKSLWKPEEDLILKTYIETHGEGNWAAVSKNSGLRREGKSCRLRWKNYLRPDIKRGGMSKEEEDLIIRMHKLLGNRWSLIAGRLPGRTDNEVKNYWNAHMNKSCPRRKNKTIHQESNNKITPSNSEDTSRLLSLTNPAEAGLDVRKEGKEQSSNLAISWIDETQSFDCNLDIPIVPGNSAMFGFDDEPFMTDWDSFVLFEAESLGCGGLRYNSQMQWIMP